VLLCDFHVHKYDCFIAERMLDAAVRNFVAIGRQNGCISPVGVLFLAESGMYDWFGQLGDGKVPANWRVEGTGGNASCILRRDQDRIVVLAGRQIVTGEQVEILSLCSDVRVPDGLALMDTVERIREVGGLPVLPWGVGKWVGRRKHLLEEFLAHCADPVLLGDNGGRPAGWGEPPFFVWARRVGRAILPGSDCLPLPGEEKRTGGYCGRIDRALPRHDIAAWFRTTLANLPAMREAGHRVSPIVFLKNQLRLRLQRWGRA